MSHLSLSFLGPFQVTLAGAPVTAFESNRARALLAYLAVEAERPHQRETLAGLFWPNWPDPGALANVRHALANLRQVTGDRDVTPPFLLITRETVQFNPASDYELDVLSFIRLATAERAGQPPVERLQQALALYRGSFLEGLSVGDSAAFEEWATLKREQLAQQMLEVLLRLAAYHEQQGDYEQAQRYAQRQLDLDPTREEAHRQLMRAPALSGQRSTALAQYLTCRRLLAEELGVEPAQETSALYESIRQGTLSGLKPAVVSGPAPGSAIPEVELLPELEEGPEAARPLFVAREGELAQLDRWLGLALPGQGRVGFVVGEPGSGKTLLLQEFARLAMVAHPELVMASGNCNAYSGLGDPYLPFLEILGMLTADIEAQRAGGGIGREHARRLWALFPTALQAVLESGPGLVDLLLPGAALLSRAQKLAPQGTAWRTRMEEALQRRASGASPLSQTDLFQQVTRVLQALAREHPLLLVLDDLQWADAGSIALLFHLGRRLAGGRILVLGAFRPEEVAAGREGKAHPLESVVYEFQRIWRDISLDLAQTEGRRFVEALVDSEPNHLGAAFREALYQHTGGQALFTVELWRGLQERGDLQRDEQGHWVQGPELDWQRLPSRVEAVIAARIARLPREAQELLAVASVEGEEFTAEVVARVQGADERELLRVLSGTLSQEHRLVRATSLRRLGEQRLSRYRFRHFLFQDYLYQRLDPVQRADLHERAGLALEALYGAVPRVFFASLQQDLASMRVLETAYSGPAGEAAVMAPELARHFQAAGLTSKAATYLQQAAERAGTFLAHHEAITYLTRCISLLSSLPDTLERARREWVLQDLLTEQLKATQGWAAPEVEQADLRKLELARQIGDAGLINYTLSALAEYYCLRGELRKALQLQTQILDWVERQPPPHDWLGPYADIAYTLLRCGEFAAARGYLERAAAPYASQTLSPSSLPTVMLGYGLTEVLDYLALVLCFQGYPERALRANHEALALARELHRGNETAVMCVSGATLQQLARGVRATQELAEELIARTREGSFPTYRPIALLLLGWAHARSGREEEGIAEMRRGLDAWRASGTRDRLSQFLALLAEGYALAGRAEEGLNTLREALEHVERTEERYYEAELHRLKGELLLQRAREQGGKMQDAGETSLCSLPPASCILPPSPEACFQKAIEVARRQEARSWELRATMSLCRLWQRQGKIKEAREALAANYGWFTEGFDTPDLQEAKALLEELAPGEEESKESK